MKQKWLVVAALFSATLLLVSFGFSGKNSLQKNDTIPFIVPPNFPKPVYDFSKYPVTKLGFALGKELFYDPGLSADKTISCSNCHQASAAFANLGLSVSAGIKGCKGKRNAPPLFNLAWQKEYMWDGRINAMQLVPVNALTDKCEMGNTVENVLQYLNSINTYMSQFAAVYGDGNITKDRVLNALTQFTAMMVSADTKYDKVMQHQPGFAFTASEVKGYHLFQQKCGTCHQEPLFTDLSYRNNGLEETSADIGRDSLTHLKTDHGKFRVPSLRNVEITWPYMHDGRFYSLKQVLQHYNTGVKAHSNLDGSLKHGNKLGIALSAEEQMQVIAFVKTLTDVNFINDRRFNNH